MKRILYTEEEGGDFHHIALHTDKETEDLFDKSVKNKRLTYSTGDRIVNIRPAYMELTETEKEFDFVLGSSRKEFSTKMKKEENG